MDQSESFNEIGPAELASILSLTIVGDRENKILTFLAMLSAYTEDSQFNVSLNAPSSSGKTYIPLEVAKLFPPEDVIKLGPVSPTAFFHDTGAQLNNESKSFQVSLERKIIIFLDQPHNKTLENLRPLLSHDEKVIQAKITDRTEKFGLRVKTIDITGYPSVIFCTASLTINDQEATRFILLSPETTQLKLRASIEYKLHKEQDPIVYNEVLESDKERQALKERILLIKREQIRAILIINTDKIRDYFLKKGRILLPRDQRDVMRVISIAKTFALLNFQNRESNMNDLMATETDVDNALKLWSKIYPSQKYNIPPFVYQVYKTVLLSLLQSKKDGISKSEIMAEYYRVNKQPIADWQLRQEIIPLLESVGLISIERLGNNVKYKLSPDVSDTMGENIL